MFSCHNMNLTMNREAYILWRIKHSGCTCRIHTPNRQHRTKSPFTLRVVSSCQVTVSDEGFHLRQRLKTHWTESTCYAAHAPSSARQESRRIFTVSACKRQGESKLHCKHTKSMDQPWLDNAIDGNNFDKHWRVLPPIATVRQCWPMPHTGIVHRNSGAKWMGCSLLATKLCKQTRARGPCATCLSANGWLSGCVWIIRQWKSVDKNTTKACNSTPVSTIIMPTEHLHSRLKLFKEQERALSHSKS